MTEEKFKTTVAGWAGLAWWIAGVIAVRSTPLGIDSLGLTLLALGAFGGPILIMYAIAKEEMEDGKAKAAKQQRKRDREWAILVRALAPEGTFDGEFYDESVARLIPWGADLSSPYEEPE